MKRPFGKWNSVALFNFGDSEKVISVPAHTVRLVSLLRVTVSAQTTAVVKYLRKRN